MRTRRSFMIALAGAPLAAASLRAAEQVPAMTIHKDPNCGCCQTWADQMGSAGFVFRVVENPAMNRLKAQLGVPQRLASCHTAEIGGYVIEGHVPPAEIHRLLREKPRARGLAVPGMPVNSPGMEVPGAADEAYDVVLFGEGGDSVFARYSGQRRI
jgi:hypothetical protein